MDRRNFLKSIGALAAAASMPSLASIVTSNKYAESIRLLDECRGITDNIEAIRRVNVLMAYLRENFPVPVNNAATLSACRKIMQLVTRDATPEVIAGIRGIPPSVADELYSVAVIKLGMTAYQISVDLGRVPEFWEFHKTHASVILSAMSDDKSVA